MREDEIEWIRDSTNNKKRGLACQQQQLNDWKTKQANPKYYPITQGIRWVHVEKRHELNVQSEDSISMCCFVVLFYDKPPIYLCFCARVMLIFVLRNPEKIKFDLVSFSCVSIVSNRNDTENISRSHCWKRQVSQNAGQTFHTNILLKLYWYPVWLCVLFSTCNLLSINTLNIRNMFDIIILLILSSKIHTEWQLNSLFSILKNMMNVFLNKVQLFSTSSSSPKWWCLMNERFEEEKKTIENLYKIQEFPNRNLKFQSWKLLKFKRYFINFMRKINTFYYSANFEEI